MNAFQAYSLEALRTTDLERAPPALDPRVEEGACAPGVPCTLTVWVGQSDGTLRVRSLAGVDPLESTAPVADGFSRFALTVMGPEARVAVEALGPRGEVTAVRDVRLPLVPGGMTARAKPVSP